MRNLMGSTGLSGRGKWGKEQVKDSEENSKKGGDLEQPSQALVVLCEGRTATDPAARDPCGWQGGRGKPGPGLAAQLCPSLR